MDAQIVAGTRLDVDAVVRSWAAAGSVLDPVSRRAVVAALAHELSRSGLSAPTWTDALYDFDANLPLVLADGRRLRTVLHDAVPADLPAKEAMERKHRIDVLVDDLIAAAAAHQVDRLEQAALLDPLTGLRNRRAASVVFDAALAHARRHGQPVAVAVADLDGLKRINDTQGHAAGDEALRQFATALGANLRAGDSAFRFGGDEFVVVAPDSRATELEQLFHRVRQSGPQFSVGFAEAPVDCEDAAGLLALADQRLYAARRGLATPPATRTIDSLEAGLAALALTAVAAAAAEGIRGLADVDVSGATLLAWRGVLVGAPLLAMLRACTAGPATVRDAWLRAATLAGIALLALVAALTPLVANDTAADVDRTSSRTNAATTTITRATTVTLATPSTLLPTAQAGELP